MEKSIKEFMDWSLNNAQINASVVLSLNMFTYFTRVYTTLRGWYCSMRLITYTCTCIGVHVYVYTIAVVSITSNQCHNHSLSVNILVHYESEHANAPPKIVIACLKKDPSSTFSPLSLNTVKTCEAIVGLQPQHDN